MLKYSKPIQIFGDESHFNGVITYALLIIPLTKIVDVENALLEVKRNYEIPSDVPIHCSELFNTYKKQKTELRNLKYEDTFSLLGDFSLSAYLAGARAWIGYWDITDAPDRLLYESFGDKNKIDVIDISGIKTKTVMVSQASMGPITHFLPPDSIEAWIDQEATYIAHLGAKKRRVDSLMRFFPVEHNDQLFIPTPVSKPKPVFLELADILAYASSHALVKGFLAKKKHYEEIINFISPGFSEVFMFDVPGPTGSVRAHDRDDKIKNYLKQFL